MPKNGVNNTRNRVNNMAEIMEINAGIAPENTFSPLKCPLWTKEIEEREYGTDEARLENLQRMKNSAADEGPHLSRIITDPIASGKEIREPRTKFAILRFRIFL